MDDRTAIDVGEIAYRQIFRDTVAPLAIMDREFRFVDANDHYLRVLGQTREALVGTLVFDTFPDVNENEAILRGAWADAFDGKSSVLSQLHYPIPRADGEMEDRWWAVHSGPVKMGPPPHDLLIFRVEDITERVRLETARTLVTQELQHRMLNLTGLIGIIARQSARGHEDVAAFVQDFLDRLTALGRSSRLLTSEDWGGLGMHDLVADTMDAFTDEAVRRIAWEGPEVVLTASAAQAIAMGLHELATNAVKYGALSRPDGGVMIRWTLAADDTLSFVWQEDGIPDAAPMVVSETGSEMPRIGFGTTLLRQSLPMQVDGRAEHEMIDGGLRYRLTAPAAAFGEVRDGR